MIRNVHQRAFAAAPERVGALLDTLGSSADALWPADRWPAMRLDRPLGAGASGGHGPIRYRVTGYTPGERVAFAFDPAMGVTGTHVFEVLPADNGGATLRHVIEARVAGRMRLAWPLAIRWLHDALLEDLLARAAAQLGEDGGPPPRWNRWVRLLRRLS